MFELFGATAGQLDEVSKHFSIQLVAIAHMLLAKGIVTEDEYKQHIAMATSQIDQAWEDRRQQRLRDNPGLEKTEKFISSLFGEA